MGELRKLLDNQAEQIKMLKGSALDPSDVAELKEAARLAEVQQDLDEELRQADSRSFGGYSRSAESAQHGRAVKRYKQQLVQRSDRKEKYLKISSAREFFLDEDGAPRAPPEAGQEGVATAAAVALQDAVDQATIAKRRCDVDFECTLSGGNDVDFRSDVYALVSDESLLLAEAPRKVVIKDALAAALVNQESRAKKAETLGVPAAAINRQRSTSAAGGAGLTPMVLALELAGVMRESTRTKEAVEEWWDVNEALLADADEDRAFFVALMEELRPALLLAKIFFSAAGEGRLEGLSGRGSLRGQLSARVG